MHWPFERSQQSPSYSDRGAATDYHDSPQWKETFLEDPILNRPSQVPEYRGLEVLKVGLILCGDGVSPYKGKHAKSHSMFCVAHAVMNFPPWLRHKFLATSLTMTVHGPHEPHDGQPSLDIPTDEHLRLYEERVPMWDHYR
jgi:hypothetical protein